MVLVFTSASTKNWLQQTMQGVLPKWRWWRELHRNVWEAAKWGILQGLFSKSHTKWGHSTCIFFRKCRFSTITGILHTSQGIPLGIQPAWNESLSWFLYTGVLCLVFKPYPLMSCISAKNLARKANLRKSKQNVPKSMI